MESRDARQTYEEIVMWMSSLRLLTSILIYYQDEVIWSNSMSVRIDGR